MPRIGELLVAAGLLTVEQVEQALRAQVMWGGRLGTNLVELHYVDLDAVSTSLGQQHQLPAALARHFEKADPALQRMLSPDFAERFSCIPLLRMGPAQHVVVASLAPLQPKQLAIIADELSVSVGQLVPAVAAELRIRYQLERVYGVRRTARFLRSRGESTLPFPAFEVLPVEPDLEPGPPSLPVTTREIEAYQAPEPGEPPIVELDAALLQRDDGTAERPTTDADPEPFSGDTDAVPTAIPETTDAMLLEAASGPSPHPESEAEWPRSIEDDLAIASDPAARERRHYVRTIADAAIEADRAMLGRIAIRKVAIGSAPRIMAGATLGEATRAIRRSTGRDRVAELVIDTLERFVPACDAAILLVIRGTTAIGWKGFQRVGAGLGEIAVPIEGDGLIPRVVEHNTTLRLPSAELVAIDRLLLTSLGRDAGDLVIVPISIASQVMCVIAVATSPGTQLTSAEPIAAAAGAAFARLIRDASR